MIHYLLQQTYRSVIYVNCNQIHLQDTNCNYLDTFLCLKKKSELRKASFSQQLFSYLKENIQIFRRFHQNFPINDTKQTNRSTLFLSPQTLVVQYHLAPPGKVKCECTVSSPGSFYSCEASAQLLIFWTNKSLLICLRTK